LTDHPTYNAAPGIRAKFLALPKHGTGIGLHRMLFVTRSLPSPIWLNGLEALKVTGSKGKGSTSAMIAAILRQLGISTGLYTSPHLLKANERIRIGDRLISDGEMDASLEWMLALRDSYESRHSNDNFGAFEVLTGAALYHFFNQRPETIVCEAGIGGRYDSTRVIPGRITALTSVELEHTELLGNSAELIAYDKADLCPDGGTLVAGKLEDALLPRLRAYCALRSITFVEAAAEISELKYNSAMMQFKMSCAGIDYGTIETGLVGKHQARNAAVAIQAVWHWLQCSKREVEEQRFTRAVREAFKAVRWPGRFERIAEDPETIIDVGHTQLSLHAVAETVREMNSAKPIMLVTGVSYDKNVRGILDELLPIATEVICTRAYHKGSPVETVAALCEAIRRGIVWKSADTIEEAMDLAVSRAREQNMTVLVAGGLFLATEAFVHLSGGDPRLLQFF